VRPLVEDRGAAAATVLRMHGPCFARRYATCCNCADHQLRVQLTHDMFTRTAQRFDVLHTSKRSLALTGQGTFHRQTLVNARSPGFRVSNSKCVKPLLTASQGFFLPFMSILKSRG
jgi:hypothetical protein